MVALVLVSSSSFAEEEPKILPPEPLELGFRDAVLGPEARDEWTAKLKEDSLSNPILVFSTLGHLEAAAGDFPVIGTVAGVRDWLLERGELLGLPQSAQLDFIEAHPFYEFDEEDSPTSTGHRLGFRVRVGDLRSPSFIWVILRNSRETIRGLYNTFDPPLLGYYPGLLDCKAEEAWGQAEAHAQSSLTRKSAEAVWFDESWAKTRTPGPKVRHWTLTAVDENGIHRHFAVSCETGAVTFEDQTNWDFAGGMLINGYDMSYPFDGDYFNSSAAADSCIETNSSPSATCTDPAFTMTQRLREGLSNTIDTWAAFTTPSATWTAGPKFTVPDIKAIAADAISSTWCGQGVPCARQNIYAFPSFPSLPQPDVTQAANDMIGHEYGHAMLRSYKSLEVNQAPPFTVRGQFTEGMCDLVGIATEDLIASSSNASYRTDWKLNPDHPFTSLRFDWMSGSAVSGKTCRSDPRRVLTYP
ncbi:MAG: hypothetical protein ACOZQL_12850 [Myxococcota bacterium]